MSKKVLLIALAALLVISLCLNGWLLLSSNESAPSNRENLKLDNCEYNGQACTCSNTGWSGKCVTELKYYWGRDYNTMFCKCD